MILWSNWRFQCSLEPLQAFFSFFTCVPLFNLSSFQVPKRNPVHACGNTPVPVSATQTHTKLHILRRPSLNLCTCRVSTDCFARVLGVKLWQQLFLCLCLQVCSFITISCSLVAFVYCLGFGTGTISTDWQGSRRGYTRLEPSC